MLDAEDGNNDNMVLASQEFTTIRRIHLENSNDLGIRRYDAFIYDGLLTGYRPEYAASPLRNPKTARVFAHYIHVVSFHLLCTSYLLPSLHIAEMIIGLSHFHITFQCSFLSPAYIKLSTAY